MCSLVPVKSVQHGVTQLQCLFSCADMIPFANAGNQEKVVDQGQARVIDLPPIESYPPASIQWFEQQGQHLPIPTETQVRIMHHTYSVLYVSLYRDRGLYFSPVTSPWHFEAFSICR